MKEQSTQYHIKIPKQVMLTAVATAVIAAGLIVTLVQVGQKQTLRQQAAAAQDNACGPSTSRPDVDACCTSDPVLNQGNGTGAMWECHDAPPPAAPQPLAPGPHPELNKSCPIGGGLTSACTGEAVCTILANSNGSCVTPVKGDPGPANNSNCAPAKSATIPNPPPGMVCEAGSTCKGGFCMKTPSTTTNGAGTGTGGGNTGGGTQPAPGPVCSGTTKLPMEEARKLNGICPEIDPGNPGKNICADFCKAAENAQSEKCMPAKNGKPAGVYHCENTNGKCQTTACANGAAQGYCSQAEGTCCKNPPPPPPPPPAAQGTAPVRARIAPVRRPIERCNPRTCRAPLACNRQGRCAGPGTAASGDPVCAGKPLNTKCGENRYCRYFGSGGINSPGLYCQAGADILPPTNNPLATPRIISGALAAGKACRNGTECQSKNCAPNTAPGAPRAPAEGSYVCK